MKHKEGRYSLFVGLIMASLLISCNTGNKVVSYFGKRKYTKGFYFNSHSTPKIVARPNNVLPVRYINDVSQMDTLSKISGNGLSSQTIHKNENHSLGNIATKASSPSLPLNGILPRVLAMKDIFNKNNPVSQMPADTGQAENGPTDYRKYNREAIGGLILGVACLALLFTGFGLLLSIPGFFLSLWGQESQKFHTLAVIGVILNLIGLVALIVFLLVEVIVIANGGG